MEMAGIFPSHVFSSFFKLLVLLAYTFEPEAQLVCLPWDIPFAMSEHSRIIIYQEDQLTMQLFTHGQRSLVVD